VHGKKPLVMFVKTVVREDNIKICLKGNV